MFLNKTLFDYCSQRCFKLMTIMFLHILQNCLVVILPEKDNFKDTKLMELPPTSPDINLREDLQFIIKIYLYENENEYSSKAGLWKSIKITAVMIKSMNEKQMKVIECQEGSINV